jgi:hypothetical protein
MSKGKATFFITNPSVIPCPQLDDLTPANAANPNFERPCAPACAAMNLADIFNIATAQPSLNPRQMMPF